jgi:GTP-binding protein Era
MTEETRTFRSAFVALIGRPNAGKSSLLNAVLGEDLAVVTSLPQTTRKRLRGVFTDETRQIVFMDTPGMHDGKHTFNKAMVGESEDALRSGEADVVCYLVDLARDFGPEEDFVAQHAQRAGVPVVVVFNKKDVCPDIDAKKSAFAHRYPQLAKARCITVAATTREAGAELLAVLDEFLTVGPQYYPPDDLTDEGLRFFASEFVRKHIILNTREEVPHAAFVEITAYVEKPQRHEVDATIHVESVGQRGIIVGPKGALITRIREGAEKELKKLTGVTASIRCHIIVTPGWRDSPRFLREMGYETERKKPSRHGGKKHDRAKGAKMGTTSPGGDKRGSDELRASELRVTNRSSDPSVDGGSPDATPLPEQCPPA